MTLPLPDFVAVGTVLGKSIVVGSDTAADVDTKPDASYPIGAQLTFEPSVPYLVFPGDDARTTVYFDPNNVVATINASGDPVTAAGDVLELVANIGQAGNDQDWYWRVTPKIGPVRYETFRLDVHADTDNYLTDQQPLPATSPLSAVVKGDKGDKGDPGRDGTNLPPDGTAPATSPALDNDGATILWLPSTKIWTPRAFKTTALMSDTDMLLAAVTSGEVFIDLEDEHYDIETLIDFGDARNWWGRGGVAGGTDPAATMFTCQDPSARVRIPARGGNLGRFMVHGNGLATRGLVIGVPADDGDPDDLTGAQTLLEDITVQACAGDGIVAGGAQNTHVRGMRAYNNGLDGARFENHLGGFVIEGYESTGNGVDGGEDTHWVNAGNSVFIGGFSEREAGATRPTVLVEGTVWNGPLEFLHPGMATGGTGGDTSHVLKHYASGDVVVTTGNFGLTAGEVAIEVCGRAANTGAGADTGPSLYVFGDTGVTGSGVSAFYMIDDKAVIYQPGAIRNTTGGPGTGNIPLLVGAAHNPGTLAQIVQLEQARRINRPQNATDFVYEVLPFGDSQTRFNIDGNGTFRHGPGGGTATDVFFGRGALLPDSQIGYGSASPIGTTSDMLAARFRRYPRGSISLSADGTITVDAADELTFANLNGHNCTKFSLSGANAKVGQKVVVHLRNGSTPGTVVFGLAADSIDWIGGDPGVPTWPAVANFHMILKFEVTDAGRFQEVAGSRAITVSGGVLAANNGSDFADAGSTQYNLHVPVLRACEAVATSNVASLSGTTTIDGVSLAVGDRALLTAQTTASQNGPWLVQAGAWTRPTDFPAAGSVKGRQVQVNGGTVYGGTLWVLKTSTTVTIDTTATTWGQANAGSYAAKLHASTHAPGGTDDLTTALSATSPPVALGTAAAGSGTGFARQGHVHPMPSLDQVLAAAADVAMGSHKITGLANGTASTDAAAFGQIPQRYSTGLVAASASNTTSDVVLGTATTIPAAALSTGTVVVVDLYGNIDCIATSGAFNIKLKVGATTVATLAVAASQTGATTLLSWSIHGQLTVEATGVSGSLSFTNSRLGRTAAAGVNNVPAEQVTGITADLSSGLALTVVASMATANAGNVLRLFRGSVAHVA